MTLPLAGTLFGQYNLILSYLILYGHWPRCGFNGSELMLSDGWQR